ncbi:MAG TPA: YfhO family protein, partial [Candidatus Acidoferrales bacterium]|nr:YfhO family protein [Candidatus Acidoferrales bacterium]
VGAGSPEEATRRLGRDPLGPVVVEGLEPDRAGAAPAAVRELVREPGRLELEVDASGPAWIAVLQSYAPGWTARVDGREVAVHPADVLFQAVPVPAGRHRLSLTYEPLSVRLGVAASLLGLLLTLGLAAWPRLSIMRPWRRSAGS